MDSGDVSGLVRLTQSVDLSTGMFSGRPLQDGTGEHLERRFAEIIAEGVRTLLVAVDDSDGVVGLLVARRDEIGAIDLTPVLHVSHLMVSPKFRRRGVGRMLLTAALHLAEERGMDHILTTAATGSREANRYLARLGFAPLVIHRVAPTSVLRRSLGITEAPERMAVLRRARLRATRPALSGRAVRRGA
ncbi:MAG TPA: GNAT family N-acetyltransferase [Jatrophihabitantaceae bacterium]|nr:GNAT family N-acetyltransferase [Jatrophihabitantaceae bacterium]